MAKRKNITKKIRLFFLFALFTFFIYYLTSLPIDVANHIEIRVYDEGITAIFDYINSLSALWFLIVLMHFATLVK